VVNIGGMVFSLQELLKLAESQQGSDRERLLMALADLCTAGDGEHAAGGTVQSLMSSVFLSLVKDAEHDIRRALAERLADCPWAPRPVITALANDDIEIARPVIAASPVLADEDLVRMLTIATIEHQIAVAARPAISEAVIAEILRRGEPAVMASLAANDTAAITEDGLAALVEASQEMAALRSPLVRHPRLSPDLAERLYVWIGQSLRAAIVARFRIDADALDQQLAAAVRQAHGLSQPSSPAFVASATAATRELEQRLVGKLNAAGQLRSGYLFKALYDGRLSLFAAAMAEMTGLTPKVIDRILSGDDPQLLALACQAAGIDRGAFRSILDLVRKLNGGAPRGDPAKAQQVFAAADSERALAALKAAFGEA